jgi:hypothetical protein
MARTPEKKVKGRAIEILRSEGAWVLPVVTGGFGIRGTPDLLACHLGRFLGIECKATWKDRPTPWQERRLSEIRGAGGLTAVIHAGNMEDLCILLK